VIIFTDTYFALYTSLERAQLFISIIHQHPNFFFAENKRGIPTAPQSIVKRLKFHVIIFTDTCEKMNVLVGVAGIIGVAILITRLAAPLMQS
jgi:hypothetical protein